MPEGLKIQVGADITQAQAALKTIVTDAEKATGKVSSAFAGIKTQIPKIKLDVDTSSFKASIFESANVKPKIKLDVDTKSLSSALAETTGTIPHVKLKVDVDASELKTAVQGFVSQGASFAGIGSSISGITNKLEGVGGAVIILENQFARLQKIAALPGLSFQQQERLQRMLASTQAELIRTKRAADIAGTGLGKFSRSSSSATQATINLGRVIQDAPFGFLGIANNLNPLLESFQRLRTSTGSAGGALKALGQSLIGAGGLGLAVSVISTGLILFGDKLFGVSKASKAAADSNKELAASISGDLVKLTTLVGLIQNVNTSNENRVKGLKAVNEQYAKYLPNLDKEGITVANIAKAYDLITSALLRQAVVKGIQKEIEEQVAKTASGIIQLEKAEETRRIATEKANNVNKTQVSALDAAIKKSQQYNSTLKDGALAQIGQRNETVKSIDNLNNYDSALARITGSLKQQLAPLLKLVTNFEDLDISLNAPKVDKKGADDTVSKAKALQSELQAIIIDIKDTLNTPINVPSLFILDPKFTALDTKAQELQKAKKFLQDVKANVLKGVISGELTIDKVLNVLFPNVLLKVDPSSISFPPNTPIVITEALQKEFDALKLRALNVGFTLPPITVQDAALDPLGFKALQKQVEDFNGSIQKAMPDYFKFMREVQGTGFKFDPINLQFAVDNPEIFKRLLDDFKKFQSDIESGVSAINGIIAGIAVDSISNLSEAIGTALAGGDLKGVFANFANILASGLTSLGKQMILLSPVIAALKAAIKSLNPAILLPAGIALVAIGAALRASLANGIKGFASGGLVSGPQLALIGEGSGTNRSNPEVVAPLDQLRSMLSDLGGGGSQRVLITGRLRGNDMLLQNARTSRSQRRTTGR